MSPRRARQEHPHMGPGRSHQARDHFPLAQPLLLVTQGPSSPRPPHCQPCASADAARPQPSVRAWADLCAQGMCDALMLRASPARTPRADQAQPLSWLDPESWPSTNHKSVFKSRDLSWPIRGQCVITSSGSGHTRASSLLILSAWSWHRL